MENPDNESHRLEIERLFRVSDQMVSQHAFLRDKYGRRAQVLDLCLVIMAGTLSAFTFAADSSWNVGLGVPVSSKVILGAGSTLIFVLSLVGWKVDWKAKKAAHADGVKALGGFKLKLRGALKDMDGLSEQEISELRIEYAAIGNHIEPVPEKYFLRSKQHHRRKVAISNYLDHHPHAALWLIRLRLRLSDNGHAAGISLDSDDMGKSDAD